MITGVVNVNREAIIRLVIHGTTGQTSEIEAVIDTGFTGFLTLPPSLLLALGLTWRGQAQAILTQTTEDWHTRLVTLSATKGLSERCFAE